MAVTIKTKTTAITPLELYKQVTQSMFDGFRAQNAGEAFLPAQFGGIYGQRTLLEDAQVLNLTTIGDN